MGIVYSRRISRRSSSEATIARLSPDYLLTPNFSHNEAGKNFRCQDEVWPKAMLLPKPKTTPKVQVGYKQQVTYIDDLFFFFFLSTISHVVPLTTINMHSLANHVLFMQSLPVPKQK